MDSLPMAHPRAIVHCGVPPYNLKGISICAHKTEKWLLTKVARCAGGGTLRAACCHRSCRPCWMTRALWCYRRSRFGRSRSGLRELPHGPCVCARARVRQRESVCVTIDDTVLPAGLVFAFAHIDGQVHIGHSLLQVWGLQSHSCTCFVPLPPTCVANIVAQCVCAICIMILCMPYNDIVGSQYPSGFVPRVESLLGRQAIDPCSGESVFVWKDCRMSGNRRSIFIEGLSNEWQDKETGSVEHTHPSGRASPTAPPGARC